MGTGEPPNSEPPKQKKSQREGKWKPVRDNTKALAKRARRYRLARRRNTRNKQHKAGNGMRAGEIQEANKQHKAQKKMNSTAGAQMPCKALCLHSLWYVPALLSTINNLVSTIIPASRGLEPLLWRGLGHLQRWRHRARVACCQPRRRHRGRLRAAQGRGRRRILTEGETARSSSAHLLHPGWRRSRRRR